MQGNADPQPAPPGAPGRGRPPRSRNKVHYIGRARAHEILSDPRYQNIIEDWLTHKTMPVEIHKLLWAYGYGKPVERIEITKPEEELKDAPTDQLLLMAREITKDLEEEAQAQAAARAAAGERPSNVTQFPGQQVS